MNTKVVKNDLEGYWYDYQYILEKSRELEKLKQEIKKSCNRLNDIRGDKFDNSATNMQMQIIMEKQVKEENALIRLMEKKQKIESVIEGIPEPYKVILYLRYIRFYTFDEVAAKMNYSTTRIYQLHREGLALFNSNYSKLQ